MINLIGSHKMIHLIVLALLMLCGNAKRYCHTMNGPCTSLLLCNTHSGPMRGVYRGIHGNLRDGSCSTSCVSGCEYIQGADDWFCVNSTNSIPLEQIQYPPKCTTTEIDIDYNCNSNARGKIWGEWCKKSSGKCVPNELIKKTIECKYEKRMQCPQGCHFKKLNNKCLPNGPDDVCEFNEKHMLCPEGCEFDAGVQKCVSYAQGVACELSFVQVYPMKCEYTLKGEECDRSFGDCGLTEYVQCPDDCAYNRTTQLCTISNQNLPQSIYKQNKLICEPYIRLQCPHNRYDTDIDYEPCASHINDICKTDDGTITYPVRLKHKYSNIMCNYSDKYCNDYNNCEASECNVVATICCDD